VCIPIRIPTPFASYAKTFIHADANLVRLASITT
jgi:hypothetical protein